MTARDFTAIIQQVERLWPGWTFAGDPQAIITTIRARAEANDAFPAFQKIMDIINMETRK